ncbi:FBX6-like protein [Mya arenaria]|uniref:FBX6-like protein n=1 Tax=Mya arenaria TaxID=6604 RepID=A0ABY7FNW8_MYAAR|nr:FBX6-like protein [Mya arenaria]
MGVSNSGFSGNNSGRIASNGDKSGRMMEWEVVGNGGDGWSVETEPIGSDPVSDFNNECKGSVGCWATSYRECAKYQVVDLMAAGCCKYVLDHVRPAIHVSEYSARRDCGAVYKMTVVLMPERLRSFGQLLQKIQTPHTLSMTLYSLAVETGSRPSIRSRITPWVYGMWVSTTMAKTRILGREFWRQNDPRIGDIGLQTCCWSGREQRY